ncbi:MAG: HlyD family efflux transporter periplasmic adaptor subunit [Paludibacteraceae bacterium]|nr:HlyD family efflux transporter periplasmic adaptor subunit [Paludibacteraceae bacterium]
MKKILLSIITAVLTLSCTKQNVYDATGTFESTEITVSAEVSGKITSLHAVEGSRVAAGQELGIIDTTSLVLQREVLRKQQSAMLSSRPDIQKQVASIREQITKQENELARLKRMKEGGAATGKQVDDVEAQLRVLRSQLDASLSTLTANVTSANNSAAAIEAQIQLIEDQIRRCHITSPTDGTILVRYAEQGEMAVAGKPLMRVADLENMYLRAYFTSDQLSRVAVGQQVKVIADFGGDEQYEYNGTVAWIAADSEFTPKGIQTKNSRANLVYATKIAVHNDGKLRIGLYGEVKL